MGDYGQAAVDATLLITAGKASSPRTAWDQTTTARFGKGSSSQEKSCPRDAYLGLCQSGLVIGIVSGNYTRSKKNSHYALSAVQLIKANSSLANISEQDLWEKVLRYLKLNIDKAHNQQMDVVLTLFQNGLIK